MPAIQARTTVAALLLSVSASAATDAGKPAVLAPHDAGPAETAGQKAYRSAYVAKTVKHELEVTKDHVWTPDIGAAESLHWRRAYKGLRIRELAEDDKETSAMARVDAYLSKLDQHFFSGLTSLVAEAPTIPAAPTLAAPAKGATLTVGQPVTISITPVADATHYYMLLWGQGRQMWSDYNPTTKQFGTTASATIAGNDPKWAKFENGKANILIRAMTPAKTKKGVPYTIWSRTAVIPVTVAGGAPAPASAVAK